tara:strand:+ start:75 stop:488 length:414 start_codon:yes stop_codon:yes gene_type:complete
MKIEAINKKHAGVLKTYIKDIQGIMFEATEKANIGKFSEINNLLSNVVRYSNTFKEYTNNPKEINEWCYMIPNLMMYASTGFLIGIKSKHNTQDINIAIDKLFETTVKITSDTHNMLDELEAVGQLEQMLTKLIKKS